MKIFAVICALIFAAASLSAQAELVRLCDFNTKQPVRYAGDIMDGNVFVPAQYIVKKNEFRGIWVATVENIDFAAHKDAESFKKDFTTLADKLKNAGFTAVIFQVRPLNDAFYPSKFAPFSRYLTGVEGQGVPSFDPLKFMVAETRKRGLEFHAWLNPYRVTNGTPLSTAEYVKTLAENNFARLHPEYVLSVPVQGGKNLMILNPGEPAVRIYLANIVQELITNYDIDAVHFDDYFYPYCGVGESDRATYKKYSKNTSLAIEDWRRMNVDIFIRGLHLLIREHNRANVKNVRFGISPFGIWANRTPFAATPAEREKLKNVKSQKTGSLTRGSQSYFTQYADTRKWVREGWIDYIVPQLYWSFAHKKAPYAALADWWADTVKGTNTALYTGLSITRQGNLPDWQDPQELMNQLKYNTLRSEIKGAVFFSCKRFFECENASQRNAAKTITEEFWKGKYPPENKVDAKK